MNKVVFRINKNKMYVVDEVSNNLSLAQFIINRLKIEASLQSTILIKDNVYISTFILHKFTYSQLMTFREYLNDLLKDKNPKYINKAVSKLRYMWLFDKINTKSVLTFVQGCVVRKKLIGYEAYIVDCENSGYSMAQKCLNNHNLKNILYKQFREQNSNFVFSVFRIFNYKEEDFLDAVNELRDTFYILNRIDEFNAANKFIQETYQVNLNGSDEDGEEETTDN